jgi:hypothetical protein
MAQLFMLSIGHVTRISSQRGEFVFTMHAASRFLGSRTRAYIVQAARSISVFYICNFPRSFVQQCVFQEFRQRIFSFGNNSHKTFEIWGREEAFPALTFSLTEPTHDYHQQPIYSSKCALHRLLLHPAKTALIEV